MARLYAATGDGIVRLDEAGDRWIGDLLLAGSGAQCLAVDPLDADTVYAGLRARMGYAGRGTGGAVGSSACFLSRVSSRLR